MRFEFLIIFFPNVESDIDCYKIKLKSFIFHLCLAKKSICCHLFKVIAIEIKTRKKKNEHIFQYQKQFQCFYCLSSSNKILIGFCYCGCFYHYYNNNMANV